MVAQGTMRYEPRVAAAAYRAGMNRRRDRGRHAPDDITAWLGPEGAKQS